MTDRKAKAKNKKSKGKNGSTDLLERLAHRSCNTKKGNVDAVVPWPDHLFVVDPSPIIPSVERLSTKGGREVMARCPSRSDADQAAEWLVDRISRLEPGLDVRSDIDEGGGQFLVSLHA